jgi:hypothetical protein
MIVVSLERHKQEKKRMVNKIFNSRKKAIFLISLYTVHVVSA